MPQPRTTLAVLLTGVFILGANTTLAAVALPAIATDLHLTGSTQMWIVNAHLIAFTAVLPAAGRLGDHRSPKRLLTTGLALFTLTATAAALAPGGTWLITARVLQGAAAALATPQALTILARTHPAARRGRAFGVWGAVAGLAVAAGPSLGGAAIGAAGWRAAFAGLAATAALAALLGALLLPATPPPPVTPRAKGVARMLLRTPGFVLMAAVSAALSTAVAAMVLLTTGHLQAADGLSPATAGALVAIGPAVSVPFAPLSGRLTDRRGPLPPLLAGLALMIAGLAGLATGLGSTPMTIASIAVFGVGMGVVFAPPGTLAFALVPAGAAGAAGGALTTLRTLGSTLGAVTVSTLLTRTLPGGVLAADPEHTPAISAAVRAAFAVPLAALVLAGLACLLIRRRLDGVPDHPGSSHVFARPSAPPVSASRQSPR
ncbi:hypothetical protein Afil01_36740 [Actinorhabdospora filicis]|uniref:Major facilitator superfamily (MFS) profile domain-containing protein n=1 Tax=Actinorhabdospora filicis TaxID=1785913 RepID=A0A9W6SMZ1_9ACTN|nr:MFS transporter [Actinorhabdospora filicis]GLZ78867.1 hypothetical protein Afil01_36740 [Actinorhabdospora filicis]